jgi:hypothetical protein
MCTLVTDHGSGRVEHGLLMPRRTGLLPWVNGGLAGPVRYPNKPPLIAALEKKGIIMRNRFVWASALALAIGAISQVETKAAFTNINGTVITNGTIIVTTRSAGDGHFFRQSSSSTADDMDDNRGPGCAPGDIAMCELLQDNGYSTKLLPDRALNTINATGGTCLNVIDTANNPALYYDGHSGIANPNAFNELLTPMLVVVSGSGSSADVAPQNTLGIPIVCGESAVIGGTSTGPSGVTPSSHASLCLYGNRSVATLTDPVANGLYMKVLNPNHPIMQGIPLDALGRVQIWRKPYPDENAHVLPSGGLPNYFITWCAANIGINQSVPAPGLDIIGVVDNTAPANANNTNYVVLAAMERGGALIDTGSDPLNPWYNYTVAPSRIVHMFVNEQGGNNTRRCFNCLTVWGRIIFLRACKWAMEEDLQPYQGLGIIDVSLVSPSTIRLGWTGSIHNYYRIDGTTSLVNPNWVPVVDSIVNNGDGARVTRTLNMASAPQAVFMRVAALP